MRRALWLFVMCLSVFASATALGGDTEYQAWLHNMPLFEVNAAPTWFQYSSKPACMNQIAQTNYATTSHFSWVYDNPCYINFISGIRSQNGPSPGVCHTFATFAAFEGQLKIDQTAKGHVPLQVEFDVDMSEEAFLVHWKGSDDCGEGDSAYYDLEELVDSGAVREHMAPWRGNCGGPDIDPELLWHAKITDFHRITDDDTG